MTQSAEWGGVSSSSGGRITWLPWGAEAFALAQEEGKPVLLSIGAVWCYWCHVMDEDTYTDPDVAAFVSEHFVAVKADNDHRPDINSRYNVGGWPSTVFLTGHGGYIAGATYLPPNQLMAMLDEVRRAYVSGKAGLYDQANILLRQRREEVLKVSAGAELGPEMVDRMARRVIGTYDARNGGFGEAPKFPSVPVLEFLLHLYRTTREDFYRAALVKTLDAMLDRELADRVDGGFFRYCNDGDWSQGQHEKMLEDNIGLARVFLEAHLLLDNPNYGKAANDTVDYLLDQLYDPVAKGFKGSQGAHSEYYGLPPDARDSEPPPPTDPWCYASLSGQTASLLMAAAWGLGREELLETGERVLEGLWEMAAGGNLPHVFSAAGACPSPDGQLLTDWAHLVNGLADASNLSGRTGEVYLERAREAATMMLEVFYDRAHGGFYDIEQVEEPLGYLALREKPLPENVTAVQGLMKLHHSTGDPEFLEAARRTLSAFAEVNRAYGEHAAGYAPAVERFLSNPLEIAIEGRPGSDGTRAMMRAAAGLTHPYLVIKLVRRWDGSPAQAHVCLDTVCWPPVDDPAELAPLVAEALSPQESPFADVFQQFGGI